MTLPLLVFYVFSTIMVCASIMVVSARNPVHSVLFLILAFFNAAGLFLLVGAEFLAMILVIVYVGAVAVLFLFVVMMLDVGKFGNVKQIVQKNMSLGLILGFILFGELIFVLLTHFSNLTADLTAQNLPAGSPMVAGDEVANTFALGRILYTDYMPLFHLMGIVLLVAMIGAIVLTLRHKATVKRQSIHDQVERRPQDVLEMRRLESFKEDA
jgi:NADH-quinone oxidoreductase subunit J